MALLSVLMPRNRSVRPQPSQLRCLPPQKAVGSCGFVWK